MATMIAVVLVFLGCVLGIAMGDSRSKDPIHLGTWDNATHARRVVIPAGARAILDGPLPIGPPGRIPPHTGRYEDIGTMDIAVQWCDLTLLAPISSVSAGNGAPYDMSVTWYHITANCTMPVGYVEYYNCSGDQPSVWTCGGYSHIYSYYIDGQMDTLPYGTGLIISSGMYNSGLYKFILRTDNNTKTGTLNVTFETSDDPYCVNKFGRTSGADLDIVDIGTWMSPDGLPHPNTYNISTKDGKIRFSFQNGTETVCQLVKSLEEIRDESESWDERNVDPAMLGFPRCGYEDYGSTDHGSECYDDIDNECVNETDIWTVPKTNANFRNQTGGYLLLASFMVHSTGRMPRIGLKMANLSTCTTINTTSAHSHGSYHNHPHPPHTYDSMIDQPLLFAALVEDARRCIGTSGLIAIVTIGCFGIVTIILLGMYILYLRSVVTRLTKHQSMFGRQDLKFQRVPLV
ncbi:US4 [anatid alphaherpesvirus 1]|nr:US4 [Anatid alphaherpesvirus 1]